MNRIGCGRGIGGALCHTLQGENFIRHIGSDKLIFDFHEGSGTTVHDKSHCGNDGILGAGAAKPTWKRNSLYFDGGDQVLLTGMSHGISTGEFTISFALDSITNNVTLYDYSVLGIEIIGNSVAAYFTSRQYISDSVINTSPLFFEITRDKNGNLECYVNNGIGNKGESNSDDISESGTIILGSTYSNTDYILATMYSFRILNKCLSGIEAQNEYLCQKFSNN